MNKAILAVQHALHEHGFDPGGFDGVWGPKSQAALDRAKAGAALANASSLTAQSQSNTLNTKDVSASNSNAYILARAEIGTVEWDAGSNPKVVAYFRDAGFPQVVDDGVAWCAAFVGAMLKRAGMKPSGSLAARSYLEWGRGISLDEARPGDLCVFKRGDSSWQGHVAFFVERTAAGIKVLGGNQRDAVNEAIYPRASLLGVRRAP